jgi:hypothetical protein
MRGVSAQFMVAGNAGGQPKRDDRRFFILFFFGNGHHFLGIGQPGTIHAQQWNIERKKGIGRITALRGKLVWGKKKSSKADENSCKCDFHGLFLGRR